MSDSQPSDPSSSEADAATTSGGAATTVPDRRKPAVRSVIEWGAIVVIALVLAFVVKQFAFQAFYIPSGSMEPTLKPGDRVLVNKLSYHLHSIHRGDIVVFSKPPNDIGASAAAIKDLIKRVIGLPGETIQSGPNSEILIDGKPISQPWLTSTARNYPGPPVARQVIPRGDYYVMGDNRGDSADSRYIGPIPGSLIVGRAFVRVWPVTSLSFF